MVLGEVWSLLNGLACISLGSQSFTRFQEIVLSQATEQRNTTEAYLCRIQHCQCLCCAAVAVEEYCKNTIVVGLGALGYNLLED